MNVWRAGTSLVNVVNFIFNHPLGSKSKIAAISRFIKWQVASRLVPGEIVYYWVNDSKLIVRRGETGLTGNIYVGLHEFYEMGYLLHVLRDGCNQISAPHAATRCGMSDTTGSGVSR